MSTSGVRSRLPRALRAFSAISAVVLLALSPGAVVAAGSASVTTPYPAVSVAPGAKVTWDLTVDSTRSEEVGLAVGHLPDGWTSSLRGGGFEVASVFATPKAPGHVTLEVDVAATATAGRYPISLTSTSSGGTSTLDLAVVVNATAAGQLTLTTDFPSQQGASGTTFTFTLTLANDTPQDLTFGMAGTGPDGWQVQARPTDQTQATSLSVKASSSSTITVTVTPPDSVPAGDYPIAVKATAGSQEVDAQLTVTIIGQYKLALTTPDGRLNAEGTAGSPTQLQLSVQNTGSTALSGVTISATPPTGWNITYSPSATIASIAANATQPITATITPSSEAIAGDYVVTFTATASQATATSDIRVTVDTSITWAIVGIGLIVIVLLGLAWIFRRFGRR